MIEGEAEELKRNLSASTGPTSLVMMAFWRPTCPSSPATMSVIDGLLKFKRDTKCFSVVLVPDASCIDKTKLVLEEMNLKNMQHYIFIERDVQGIFSTMERPPFFLRVERAKDGDLHFVFEASAIDLLLTR